MSPRSVRTLRLARTSINRKQEPPDRAARNPHARNGCRLPQPTHVADRPNRRRNRNERTETVAGARLPARPTRDPETTRNLGRNIRRTRPSQPPNPVLRRLRTIRAHEPRQRRTALLPAPRNRRKHHENIENWSRSVRDVYGRCPSHRLPLGVASDKSPDRLRRFRGGPRSSALWGSRADMSSATSGCSSSSASSTEHPASVSYPPAHLAETAFSGIRIRPPRRTSRLASPPPSRCLTFRSAATSKPSGSPPPRGWRSCC